MTRDDIIKMAREAGCVDPMVFLASYERFAALVRADEREACAKVCEKVVFYYRMGPKDCAAFIRARGNT